MKYYRGIPFADYELSVRASAGVLRDYQQTHFPIVLEQIIDAMKNEVALITYSSLSRKRGISFEEVVMLMDSELGSCAYDSGHNRYIIFYNDTKDPAFCRFTIAHELGHIILNHHILAGTNALSRSFVPHREYIEYENEANAFARNLLSPAPMANSLLNGWFTNAEKYDRLMRAFNITKLAAKTRIAFISRDINNCSPEILQFYSGLKIGNHPYVCVDCSYLLPENAVFCPICGSHRKVQSLLFNRYPKVIRTDSRHSVRRCIVCGNTKFSAGSWFCRICGFPAINLCTGIDNAQHRNRHYARFCITCGAMTVFRIWNMFQSEVDYMHEPVNYNDGVDFEKNSMMVKICPRCGNTVFSENAMFCRICGADLHNRCEGERDGNEIIEDSRHSNPSNARYCEKCGKRTSFLIEQILCSYEEFVPSDETPDTSGTAFAEEDYIPWEDNNTAKAAPVEEPQPVAVPVVTFNAVEIDELPF